MLYSAQLSSLSRSSQTCRVSVMESVKEQLNAALLTQITRYTCSSLSSPSTITQHTLPQRCHLHPAQEVTHLKINVSKKAAALRSNWTSPLMLRETQQEHIQYEYDSQRNGKCDYGYRATYTFKQDRAVVKIRAHVSATPISMLVSKATLRTRACLRILTRDASCQSSKGRTLTSRGSEPGCRLQCLLVRFRQHRLLRPEVRLPAVSFQ
jgi:hypothetical protein